jgi:hypothetical protein
MGSICDSPCRYCVPPKRNEWCHETCKEYADYRADLDTQARRRHQEGAVDAVLAEGAKERKIRHYKRGGKH